MLNSICLAALCLLGLPLQNGTFQKIVDEKPVNWTMAGDCRVISGGGLKSSNAIELRCSGDHNTDSSACAKQVLTFETPHRGAFVVKGWIKIDEIGDSGDCGINVDSDLEGGLPLWGQIAVPDRTRRDWQEIKAVVRPARPMKNLVVSCVARDVKARVRFCNVNIEEPPLKIESLDINNVSGNVFDVRASIGEYEDWKLEAKQNGKIVWKKSGADYRVSERITASDNSQLTVSLTAYRDGKSVCRTVKSKGSTPARLLDCWVADSFTRIFQDAIPLPKSPRSISLDMARNERESFQICIRPALQRLRNVSVVVSDLKSGANKISSSNIKWNRVGYVWVEKPASHPYAQMKTPCWWPDPLLAATDFNVEDGITQPLWLTVYTPAETPAGRYKGYVTISVNKTAKINVPVSINVYKARIPKDRCIKTAFSLTDTTLEQIYKGIPARIRRSYTDYLLECRINPDDIYRNTPPPYDDLAYAVKNGANMVSAQYVWPEPGQTRGLPYPLIPAVFNTDFKTSFYNRLDKIAPELKKRGLLDKTVVYGFDETAPDIAPAVKEIFGEVKRKYPEIKTASTCHVPFGVDPLSLNIDYFVPITYWYDHKEAQQLRKRGAEVWWYISLMPGYPYANWLLESPLIEARTIFWQTRQYNVTGFLYWGVNIWWRKNNDRIIPDKAGPRLDWSVTTGGIYDSLNGDGTLLYPGKNGPIGSIRIANIRDGLEDIELLKQYGTRYGDKAEKKIISRISTDMTHLSRDPANLKSARLEVLEKL